MLLSLPMFGLFFQLQTQKMMQVLNLEFPGFQMPHLRLLQYPHNTSHTLILLFCALHFLL